MSEERVGARRRGRKVEARREFRVLTPPKCDALDACGHRLDLSYATGARARSRRFETSSQLTTFQMASK